MTPNVLPFGFPHFNRYHQGVQKNSLRSDIFEQPALLTLIALGDDKRGTLVYKNITVLRLNEIAEKQSTPPTGCCITVPREK